MNSSNHQSSAEIDYDAERLRGRVALVTAGSDGLGLACALRLARAGCSVIICGRSPDRLAQAQTQLEAAGAAATLTIRADLTKAADVTALIPQIVTAFGGLDILIANSGHIAYGDLESLTDQQWEEAFNLILMSVVRLSRAAIPEMRKRQGGDIVILTSATLQSAPQHLLLSSVFRFGVASLAKSLSHAVAADGIRVNVVAPGYFDTGRVRSRIDALVTEDEMSREKAVQAVAGDIPMGRIGQAEELAEVVAFLVSHRARFVNGATIAIDGGKGRSIF